jgi:hypothetical protein
MHRHKECVYRAELNMENAGVDAGQELPDLALGDAAASSDVRLSGHRAAVYDPE